MSVTSKPAKGGSIDVEVTRDVCGEPIIGSDQYGMYCKNRCHDAENKAAKKKVQAFLKGIGGGNPFQKMHEDMSRGV